MTKFSLNLPKYRLSLQLVKRRGGLIEEPLLPKLTDIRNTRNGNKVSRFFRHIFEHKSLRRVLGGNLALAIIASSAISPNLINAQKNVEVEQGVISVSDTNFSTNSGIHYPTLSVSITQGYSFFHPGIDLDGITGDPISPIMNGKVEAIQFSKFAYGNAILLNHGNGLESLYGHLSKINVKEGQDVSTTTIIGLMGATGRASGDHLHLEVRVSGRPINPLSILPKP